MSGQSSASKQFDILFCLLVLWKHQKRETIIIHLDLNIFNIAANIMLIFKIFWQFWKVFCVIFCCSRSHFLPRVLTVSTCVLKLQICPIDLDCRFDEQYIKADTDSLLFIFTLFHRENFKEKIYFAAIKTCVYTA